MTKRKLTKQQQLRIKKIQDNRLLPKKEKQHAYSRIETGSETGSNSGNDSKSEHLPGTIVSHYGATLDVEDTEGHITLCSKRQNLEQLVCGDTVSWVKGKELTGVITALAPRRNLLTRTDNYGKLKPIAANIDQVIIICATAPMFREALIDRYLVAIEHLDILPVIVLNKTDLHNKNETRQFHTQLSNYADIGYQLIATCAKSVNGLDQLLRFLNNKTSILVGQSGVGKSTIIKNLLPDEKIQIGEISNTTEKGKHTTTVSRLYHLTTGGNIIDSPGVRDFGLGSLSDDAIINGFVEFRPFIGQCKFKNCTHIHEPDCALLHAKHEGKIDQRRLNSYYHLVGKDKK